MLFHSVLLYWFILLGVLLLFLDFILTHWILVAVLVVAVGLYLFDDESIYGGFDIIDQQELVHLLNSSSQTMLVDLRPLEKHEASHITHAQMELPSTDYTGTVIFYCQDGVTSIQRAAEFVKQSSCHRVCVLRDGFRQWVVAELPVVSD